MAEDFGEGLNAPALCLPETSEGVAEQVAGEVTVRGVGVSDASPLANTRHDTVELTCRQSSRLARIKDDSPSPYEGSVRVESFTQCTGHRYYPHLAAFAVANYQPPLVCVNVFPLEIHDLTPPHAGLREKADQQCVAWCGCRRNNPLNLICRQAELGVRQLMRCVPRRLCRHSRGVVQRQEKGAKGRLRTPNQSHIGKSGTLKSGQVGRFPRPLMRNCSGRQRVSDE